MRKLKGEILLFITAFIWGTAFVFQSMSANLIGPFLFNGLRFMMAAVIMFPFMFKKDDYDRALLYKTGLILGIILFIAPNFQQFALKTASAGKAGFITSLYIVLVPFINFILFKKKLSKEVLLALCIALVGLYLLCGASLDLEFADISLIICAFFFAIQIVVVECVVDKVHPLKLSFLQYFFGGLFALIAMIFFESNDYGNIVVALPSLLYTGICSTAIAYTLQIIGQKSVDSALASMIMSFESVFAALAGFVVLHQKLSHFELLGCILMFIAVIMAQKNNGEE